MIHEYQDAVISLGGGGQRANYVESRSLKRLIIDLTEKLQGRSSSLTRLSELARLTGSAITLHVAVHPSPHIFRRDFPESLFEAEVPKIRGVVMGIQDLFDQTLWNYSSFPCSALPLSGSSFAQ